MLKYTANFSVLAFYQHHNEAALIRIINGFKQEDEEREEDPLLKIINGEVGDEDGEQ